MVFSVPAVPFTQKTAVLGISKLQSEQKSNNFQTPTDIPLIYFIANLFQDKFLILIFFHVDSMN
jgi:hypothetical protein